MVKRHIHNEQKYWFDLGSNQQIYNCDNGKFIEETESTYEEIKNLTDTSENVNTIFRVIFGNEFLKKTLLMNRQVSVNLSIIIIQKNLLRKNVQLI